MTPPDFIFQYPMPDGKTMPIRAWRNGYDIDISKDDVDKWEEAKGKMYSMMKVEIANTNILKQQI